MLELGCGRGDLLAGAAERGWDVFGVEMTDAFARSATARGAVTECATIEDSELLARFDSYDVVVLAAVLEHLYEPLTALRQSHRALKPEGLIYIDVPNESSLTMRLGNLYMRARRRDWSVNLSPTFSPFHVVGFDADSLRQALDLAGFEVHDLRVVRWGNRLPGRSGLIQRVERAGLSLTQSAGARMGMGDGLVCWAIRR
jgi:SAM-dependent methyltransferase